MFRECSGSVQNCPGIVQGIFRDCSGTRTILLVVADCFMVLSMLCVRPTTTFRCALRARCSACDGGHSRNNQRTTRDHSGQTEDTFRAHQGTLRRKSERVWGTFRVGRIRGTFRSLNIQGTISERSRNIQVGEHSGNN